MIPPGYFARPAGCGRWNEGRESGAVLDEISGFHGKARREQVAGRGEGKQTEGDGLTLHPLTLSFLVNAKRTGRRIMDASYTPSSLHSR